MRSRMRLSNADSDSCWRVAYLLADGELDLARDFRFEIRVAAETEAIGAVRRAERAAARKHHARAAAEADAEFRIPRELAAEGLVIDVAEREPRGPSADLELVLHERLGHQRVFIERPWRRTARACSRHCAAAPKLSACAPIFARSTCTSTVPRRVRA